ncbi:MAG: chemotaxis protein CheA [Gammaproteobacteria bacterium]
MSFGADEEILQDFLLEAGEILEKLSEQLVDLENHGDDHELLNAIFRGFHTIKGGAGFLQLDALVELCHIAENVFDDLRNGKFTVNAEIMDVVLLVLDAVNDMFSAVSNRCAPSPADRQLIGKLEAIVRGEMSQGGGGASTTEPTAHSEPTREVQPEPEPEPELNDVTTTPTEQTETGDNDEISESEFERLLNELHGVGGVPGRRSESIDEANSTTAISDDSGACADLGGRGDEVTPYDPNRVAQIINSSDDEISDDEFESLLDALHGEGKSISAGAKTKTSEPDVVPREPVESMPASASRAPSPSSEPSSASSTAQTPATAANKPPGKESALAAETTVRVYTHRLDEIMNMVGELVLVRNRLVRLGLKSSNEAMTKAVANLDVVTADLQTSVMKTRMQPIKKVFGRFPRVVRDLARSLKKEVNLELRGEETDLDKNLVDALADPLVHLVRNAVDHGIESPETREAMGKNRQGKVILSAEQEGDHIALTISDDGGGMDADVLRVKAVDKGLMDQEAAERLSDFDAYNLIFAPGFSTREEISDVSGRGVGMDVVKTTITQLNGTIDVQSEKGKGSVIAVKVPLTLAIMPTLMVMLGKQTFALPLVNVNEIFHLDLSMTNCVDGQEVVIVREKALPLFHLKRWLVADASAEDEREGHVVIVAVGTQKVGFVVDQLIGQEEVVIKPLGRMLNGTAGMAGATITGDGRIALILDIPSMLNRYAACA